MSVIAPERIRTARLIYERPAPEHAAELAGLMLLPEVLEWLWPFGEPPDEAELRARHRDKMAHWERHGFGQWCLRDGATGQFVGRGGPQYTEAPGERVVELGWAIRPERWGEGLATELALTSVRVAFEELGLERLVAFTMPHNLASRRVMEKAGFAYERDFEHAGVPHVLYVLRRDDC